MNICFSIDALSPAGDQSWRLCTDNSWRSCTFAEPLKENDVRITDKATAGHWAGRKLVKDRDKGLVAREKAGTFSFLVRDIYAHVVLHRLSAAPVPDKQQMLDTVRGMQPGTPWLLYLDVAGHFRTLDTSSTRIIGNLDIAVRGEIASSPEYVGPKAADDDRMMDLLWRQFLAGWLEHLKSSKMSVFVPDVEKLKEELADLDAIRNWQHEQPEA